MALASASLRSKDFGKGGGGGLLGIGHNCRLTGFQVVEHHLEKIDKTTKAVTERFPTNCFLKYTINVLDPLEEGQPATGEQFAQFGRLPLARMQQLGEPGDPKFPGGYVPSMDNEHPAPAGPFILLDGVQDIWEGAEAAMFLKSIEDLAGASGVDEQYLSRIDKMGVASLDGIEVLLNTKTKPKGKKAAADPNSKDRSVIVVEKVNRWPWEAGAGASASVPVAAAASAPTAAPTAAVQQPTAAPTAAQPAAASGDADLDALAIDRIKKVVSAAGGTLPKSELLTKLFASVGDLQAASKMGVMQRANKPDWIAQAAAAGHFLVDETSIMVIG